MTSAEPLSGCADAPEPPVRVLACAGGSRRDSFDRRVLAAAQTLAPPGVTVDRWDLGHVPPFDPEAELPAAVSALSRAIEASDALLVATSVTSAADDDVLLEALEWVSRPFGDSVLRAKVAGIVGVTTAHEASTDWHLAVRRTLAVAGTYTVLEPEVVLTRAPQAFRGHRLVDGRVVSAVEGLLEEMASLVRRLSPHRTG